MSLKKLLAITLVLAMVLSFMPTYAFASGDDATEEPVSEAAAEEPVVEEDPVVEEEPEAPQEEPETWDASEEIFPEEPVEEPEVGALVYVSFNVKDTITGDLTQVESFPATATTGGYYMDEQSLETAKTSAKKEVPGKVFNGWIDNATGKAIELGDSSIPFAGALTVYAEFGSAETFAVTYAVSPNQAPFTTKIPSTNPETVEYGKNPTTFTDTSAPSGYTFDGFYVDGTKYDILSDIEVKKAITVTATWEAQSAGPWTVTFDYNGATTESIWGKQSAKDTVVYSNVANGTVLDNTKDYNPAPVNKDAHMLFAGWVAKSPSTLKVTDAITENVTFTASWKAEEFTVSYDGYNYTEKVPYKGHAQAAFTPTAPEGQNFVGWSLTEGGTTAVSLATYEITENTKFYPIYSAQTVVVTFKVDGTAWKTQNVPVNGKATDPGIPVKRGYHLTGWTYEKEGVQVAFSFDMAITKAMDVNAVFEGNRYILEIDTTGITETVTYGATEATAKAIENPVDVIAKYPQPKKYFVVQSVFAKGYTFENPMYLYEYVDDDGTKHEVNVSDGNLSLSKVAAKAWQPTETENEYKLVLKPRVDTKNWVVDFVSEYNKVKIETINPQYVVQGTTARVNTTGLSKEGDIVTLTTNGVTYYQDGWYTDKDFTTKYDFNAYVKSNMTLYAKWLPFQTVTFKINTAGNGATFADETIDDKTVLIPKGMTFESAAANEHLAVAPYKDTYVLPKGKCDGFDTLKWMNGESEFTVKTAVNSDLTLKDSWSVTIWTVTFDANGGTLTTPKTVEVHNGKPVAKPSSDPTKDGSCFNEWVYTNKEGKEVPYPFNSAVESNFTIKATWTAAVAKVGTTPYPTLAEAVTAANKPTTTKPTITLLADVKDETIPTIKSDMIFDFGSYTVTGEAFESNGATLTVKGGIFAGGSFKGNVQIQDGTFTGTTFSDATFVETAATPTTPKIFIGGKFNAVSARLINELPQVKTTWNKILAVVASSPDGYYRCVDRKTLSLNFKYAVKDDNKTPVVTGTTLSLPIGVGETPAHAIKEYLEVNKATSDPITSPTKATSVTANVRFDKWLKGDASSTTALDLNAVCSDNITATANWITQYAVTYTVYASTPEHTDNVDKDAKATAWDASEIIAKHNKDVGPAKQDEFECWAVGSKTGDAFDFSKPITDNTKLFAKMKAKVVFRPQDPSQAPVVIQVKHGDRLSKYSSQIPTGTWVNESGNIVNLNDVINSDVTYVPQVVDNKDWNLLSVEPSKGFTYSYDAATATGKGTYKGTALDPVVVVSDGSATNTVTLKFEIEAPATVTSAGYQVSVDNGGWLPPSAAGVTVGQSPNKNVTYTFSEEMTGAQIKSVAKAGTAFTYSIKFRPNPTTATPNPDPVASFTFTFDPSNLKITNYNATGNASKVLLITDGKYEYTIAYNMNGATEKYDSVTKEYGQDYVIEANPGKTDYQFFRWVGSDGTEYYGGYEDENGNWHPLGKTIDGKKYGGWLEDKPAPETGKQFVKNHFTVTGNVTLKAEWVTVPVVVEVSDHDKTTKDESFIETSLVSEVVAKLPTPQPNQDEIFEYWTIFDGTEYVNVKGLEKKEIGAYGQVSLGSDVKVVKFKAQYTKNITAVTFKDNNKNDLLVVKKANSTLPKPSDFYNEEVKAVEKTVDLFKYWTEEAPRTDGTWAKAPAEYNFRGAVLPTHYTLYAYIPFVEYTVKIHAAGSTEPNVISVVHGNTIPSKDLPVVEGQVGWSTVDPATAQPVDFPADTPIKADTEIWAYYQIFTVKYDANGGKDAPKDQTKVFGIDLELSKDEPTLIGREFLGWAKTATATEPEFKGGDKYKENKDVTLYAVWSEGEPVTEFVKRAYSLILGREADQEGLDYWVKGLQDKTFKGGDIVSQFMNSDEYVLANHPNAEAVTAVYKTMLDREPDAEGQAYWVGLLDEGASYNLIINGFCDSAEFKGICEQYGIEPGTVATERRDENLKVTGFVSRNYKCALNRTGDSFGLNYWAGQLLDKAQTPYEVAHGFVFSEECVGRNLNNTQFVTMLYKLYMDREPEADGLAYWVGQLDNKTMTREEVEKGFADSPEFAEIIKSYGL